MSRVLQKQSVAQLRLLSLGMGLLPASLPPHRLKAATLCVVLLSGLITVSNLRQQSLSNVFLSSSKCLLPYSDSPPPSHGSTAKNSATGRVFKGHVIRKFVGPLYMQQGADAARPSYLRTSQNELRCSKWR